MRFIARQHLHHMVRYFLMVLVFVAVVLFCAVTVR